jgi:Zn-dependent protease with chaperone function
MLNVDMYRYERENIFFLLNAILGGMIWAFLILINFTTLFAIPLLFLPPLALINLAWGWGTIIFIFLLWWLAREFFKAKIFCNSIRVSESQYPEIYKMALDMSKELGMIEVPFIFVVNVVGEINAFALRFIGHSYVILNAAIVDLMLKRQANNELRMIIGHELAHHAAGHVSILKNLLIFWCTLIPIWRTLVWKSWRRACELTADRIGMLLTGEREAAMRALTSIAGGTESLSSKTNIPAVVNQKNEVITLFAFLNDLVSTHPRITRRLDLLEAFAQVIGMPERSAAGARWLLYGVSGPLAGKAVELDSTSMVIGRDARMANLVLPESAGQVSKRHCQLRYDPNNFAYSLEDCGSTNGTFLGSGQKLAPHTPYPLRHGERFYLATPEISFELRAK